MRNWETDYEALDLRVPLAPLQATASRSASAEPCQTFKMQLDSGEELTRITSPFTLRARSKKPALRRFPPIPIHLSQESLQNWFSPASHLARHQNHFFGERRSEAQESEMSSTKVAMKLTSGHGCGPLVQEKKQQCLKNFSGMVQLLRRSPEARHVYVESFLP